MIASTAITLGVPLAANNQADFKVFVEPGVELVKERYVFEVKAYRLLWKSIMIQCILDHYN